MTTTHELSGLPVPADVSEQSAVPRPIAASARACASGPAAGPCTRPALDRRGLLRGAAAAGGAVVAAAGLSACGHILEPNENVADGTQPSGMSTTDMTAADMSSPSAMSSTAAKQMNGDGAMEASKMPTQHAQMPATKPSGTSLGMASQIPVGGGVVFADHHVVVTQPNAGTYKAFSSVCTHAGCQCDNVSSGMITCPCHGAAFSISDGSALRGPTQTPLPARTVTVTGGELRLQA